MGVNVPWYPHSQLLLHRDIKSKYPQRRRRSGQHDDEPEIQLRFGPVIFPPSLYYQYFSHIYACSGVRWRSDLGRSDGKGRVIVDI